MATMSLSDDLADYATLSGVAHRTPGSNNSSLREAPNVSKMFIVNIYFLIFIKSF